jgi:hypothetical protein
MQMSRLHRLGEFETKEEAESYTEYFRLEKEMLRARKKFLQGTGESPGPLRTGDRGSYLSR